VLTADQITALAPDAASLKAGRGLATPRKWQSLGADETALWGLALGSGAEPYQTRVHLTDLASKCSCPSRKFPCKHALGLMLLRTADGAAFTAAPPPAWVTEWLEARAAREDKATERAAAKPAKPVDEAAAQKRREQRQERVGEGVALLQQALFDLTREGLAAPSARNHATWENLAKRMIDCQAPRLAGWLDHLAEDVLTDPAADQLLPWELGRLHLLLHCAQHQAALDDATRFEIQQQLGGRSTDTTDEGGEEIQDQWFVAGRRGEERDRLLTSTTWLHGLTTGRWAMVLRFAVVPQTITEPWPLGATVQATLRMVRGLAPQRAQDLGSVVVSVALPELPKAEDLTSILRRHAETLAVNPFHHRTPFLCALRPAAQGGLLRDPAGAALPWQAQADETLLVQAVCGPHPTLMCGEWDGRRIRLLALNDAGHWLAVSQRLAP
jgi:hypothetical protein